MVSGQKDYRTSKIYKLVNSVNNKVYVGATTSNLRYRKHWHKTKGKIPEVKAIFDEVGWDKMEIVLIENYPCYNADMLKERRWHWHDKIHYCQRHPHLRNPCGVCKRIEQMKMNQPNARIHCECGSTVRRDGLKKHKKSSKHINWFWNKTLEYIHS